MGSRWFPIWINKAYPDDVSELLFTENLDIEDDDDLDLDENIDNSSDEEEEQEEDEKEYAEDQNDVFI